MEIQFLEYNRLAREMLNEQDTLDNALTNLDKPSAEDKKHLIDTKTWAKYAFQYQKEYFLTYFKDGVPFACVDNYFMGISIDFLELNQKDELFNFLSITYKKFNTWNSNSDEGFPKFPKNQLFLSQVNLYQESDEKHVANELFFNLPKGIMQWDTNTETLKPDYQMEYEERETKVDMQHNFVRPPKTYVDYDYLLDYQNILKPEFLDLSSRQMDNDEVVNNSKEVYKTHEGKDYTKEEWEAYEKQQWEDYKKNQ